MAACAARLVGPAAAFALAVAAGYACSGCAALAGAGLGLAVPALVAVVGGLAGSGGLGLRSLASPAPVVLAAVTLGVGALVGAAGAPVLLDAPPGAGAAVAAGSGWYSFTGPYLAAFDARLGLVGFAANIVREAFAIVAYPLLARLAGPLPAVSAGGATTMDTSLPVIAAQGGPAAAGVALAHGALVTAAVPLVLPLLYP